MSSEANLGPTTDLNGLSSELGFNSYGNFSVPSFDNMNTLSSRFDNFYSPVFTLARLHPRASRLVSLATDPANTEITSTHLRLFQMRKRNSIPEILLGVLLVTGKARWSHVGLSLCSDQRSESQRPHHEQSSRCDGQRSLRLKPAALLGSLCRHHAVRLLRLRRSRLQLSSGRQLESLLRQRRSERWVRDERSELGLRELHVASSQLLLEGLHAELVRQRGLPAAL